MQKFNDLIKFRIEPIAIVSSPRNRKSETVLWISQLVAITHLWFHEWHYVRPPTHFRFLLLMFFVLISFVFLSISGKIGKFQSTRWIWGAWSMKRFQIGPWSSTSSQSTRQNQDNYKQVKHITKEFFKIKANASFFVPDIKTVFFILDGVNFAKIFWRESHRFLHAWNLDELSLHWMMCYHHSPCLLLQHSVWKSPIKSHFITLRAKRAMLTTKIPL